MSRLVDRSKAAAAKLRKQGCVYPTDAANAPKVSTMKGSQGVDVDLKVNTPVYINRHGGGTTKNP